jgi:prevent-host-death family protein
MSNEFVTLSELRNRLGYHLRRVRSGATLLIRERGRVVARLAPADDGDVAIDDSSWIAELERRGALRRPTAALPRTWLAGRPAVRADVVRALLGERNAER